MHDIAILEERFRSAAVGREAWSDPLTTLTDNLGAKMGQIALVANCKRFSIRPEPIDKPAS